MCHIDRIGPAPSMRGLVTSGLLPSFDLEVALSALGVRRLYVPKRTRKSEAVKQQEMSAGIWTVVSELHEQSPFAKDAVTGDEEQSSESCQRWNLPFHKKVTLWRLVAALHEKGQVSVPAPSHVRSMPLFQYPG